MNTNSLNADQKSAVSRASKDCTSLIDLFAETRLGNYGRFVSMRKMTKQKIFVKVSRNTYMLTDLGKSVKAELSKNSKVQLANKLADLIKVKESLTAQIANLDSQIANIVNLISKG